MTIQNGSGEGDRLEDDDLSGPIPSRPQGETGTRAPAPDGFRAPRVPVVTRGPAIPPSLGISDADPTIRRSPVVAPTFPPSTPRPAVPVMPPSVSPATGMPELSPAPLFSEDRSARQSRGWIWVVACAAIVLAAVGGTALFATSTRSSTGEAVRLEAFNDQGSGAFTASFATVPDADVAGFSSPITLADATQASAESKLALTLVDGNASGLFGVAGSNLVCNRSIFLQDLARNPGVASQWTATLGIADSSQSIRTYVTGLSPVILGKDTAVTDHEMRSGQSKRVQAILQKGTAVLIDNHGIPRVRCNTGSPLGSTDIAGGNVSLNGTKWNDFSANQVIAIKGTDSPLTRIEAVQLTDSRVTAYTLQSSDSGPTSN